MSRVLSISVVHSPSCSWQTFAFIEFSSVREEGKRHGESWGQSDKVLAWVDFKGKGNWTFCDIRVQKLMKGQGDNREARVRGRIWILLYLELSHRLSTMQLIFMNIFHSVLYTFPKELTRRICWRIKNFLNWWSLP